MRPTTLTADIATDVADTVTGDVDQHRLLLALADAANTFAIAKNQHERLWSMYEYLEVVLELLERLPVTLPMLAPHNALNQALATHAGGSPHPLLAPVKLDSRPAASPARLVDHVVAIVAAEVFYRGGMKRGEAARTTAHMLTGLGVEGAKNRRLTQATVTNWRSAAGKNGSNADVGKICDRYLADLPAEIDTKLAATIAKDMAIKVLAVRYQAQDSA